MKNDSLIKESAVASILLLSKVKSINSNISFYYDNCLKSMYDQNFFYITKELDADSYNIINKIRKNNGLKHIKIRLDFPSIFLINKEFECSKLLLMVHDDRPLVTKNPKISFKHLQNENIFKDLLDIEIRHYGQIYGNQFILDKMHRFFNVIKVDARLDFIACYLDKKIVGYTKVFIHKDTIEIDGLLVDTKYRKQYIATSLFAYIKNYYKCSLWLYALDKDTVKEMYKKMGFNTIGYVYDYLKIDQ